MDHAVSLVQAYLQLNGYFTSAEYPVVSATNGSRRYRTITDIDVLAFRFPNFPRPELEGKAVSAGGAAKPDPGLGIPEDRIDMIIGEVKEGRVNFNTSARDPEVLMTVLSRFGATRGDEQRIIEGIRARGEIALESGYQVRLVAFGAMPPGDEVPPCRIISLGRVLQYLQTYVRVNWTMLRQCQFKDQALGFLMTLEKARRGGAGRRGEGGIEVVLGGDLAASDDPDKSRRRTDSSKPSKKAS
jgi:hypothetical protein